MANGHGGRRVGAGRRRKAEALRGLDANASHRGRVLPHPSAPAPGPEEAPTPPTPAATLDAATAPTHLTPEERRIWLRLAPHAVAAGTLTSAWAFAFELLCQNIAREQRYALSVQDMGGSSHRGLIQIIDRELLRFGLSPIGKPVEAEAAAPAVDPLESKYFGRA